LNELDCLHLYCEHLVKKYGDPSHVAEDLKADEFREFFIKDLPVNVRSLRLVACVCGFNTEAIESDKMPAKLRGYHEMIDNKKTVYYREEDSQSGIQNTILHETREMIEPFFIKTYPGYRTLKTRALHIAANHFAAAVLLPQERFIEDIYNTGFDVLALAKKYSKSCAQILLRMGEVLQGKIFFYGALYEPEAENADKWAVTYLSQSTESNNGLAYWYMMNGYLPKKGRGVKPGSFIEQTIKTGKSYLVGYQIKQGKKNNSFIMLSQPQIISKCANKVVVVIIPEENRNLLDPQINHLNPIKLNPMLH
jgi:hypothetical protein